MINICHLFTDDHDYYDYFNAVYLQKIVDAQLNCLVNDLLIVEHYD